MISDGIRKARKVAGITQENLAKALGVNRATISKYENGSIDPSISQLRKIASVLHVTIYDLIDGGPGALDRLLPPAMWGIDFNVSTVDEDTLRYMLDQLIHVEEFNPELYQKYKDILYLLAVSSNLEHVLFDYGAIYDIDKVDIESEFSKKKVAEREVLNRVLMSRVPNNQLGTEKVSTLHVGDTYFDGAVRVAQIEEGRPSSVILEVDEDRMSADELMTFVSALEKISKQSKVSIEGLALLAEAASKALALNLVPPQSTPAPPEGTDTTPPTDAPETPPEGK